mmetsp:Transcript_13681/g.39384  ORF Transcript_13681/g.39384 Transcript_13681/m.39384 type:complete len:264 (+) Transcript_13681:1638-2429(+)
MANSQRATSKWSFDLSSTNGDWYVSSRDEASENVRCTCFRRCGSSSGSPMFHAATQPSSMTSAASSLFAANNVLSRSFRASTLLASLAASTSLPRSFSLLAASSLRSAASAASLCAAVASSLRGLRFSPPDFTEARGTHAWSSSSLAVNKHLSKSSFMRAWGGASLAWPARNAHRRAKATHSLFEKSAPSSLKSATRNAQRPASATPSAASVAKVAFSGSSSSSLSEGTGVLPGASTPSSPRIVTNDANESLGDAVPRADFTP